MGYTKELIEFITKDKVASVDEAVAATDLITRLGELCLDYSKMDRNRILNELQGLTKETKLDELESDQYERACELTSELSFNEEIEQKIKSDTLTLIALNYLVKDTSCEQIRKELKGERWAFKHEVLTRWAWLTAQKKAIQKGRPFSRPFLCEVGPRVFRQNLDREFYTYLKFMPHYQERFQKGYLLFEYCGWTNASPDFIAANEEGAKIGIEVTEATESEEANVEAKNKECLMNELVKEFQGLHCHFTIWSRPNWSFLLGNIGELKRWLKNIFDGKEFPPEHHEKDMYSHPGLELTVSFEPMSTEYLFFDLSGDGTGSPYEGDEIEYRLAKAVEKRLAKKLSCPAPAIKPCLLVIYDNARLPLADYRKVIKLTMSESPPDTQIQFDEIWLIDDQQCTQLMKL